jgi:hypothetical protein
MKVWVWSRASQYRIFGGQSGILTGLYLTNSVFPVSITLPVLHTHFFIHHQRYIMKKIKGVV